PADDFPSLPSPNSEEQIILETKQFSKAIRQTAFATATDASKSVLTGVYMSAKGKQVKLAATDGYRLAERTITVKKITNDLEVIIPRRTLIELDRLLKQTKVDTFALSSSVNQIIFQLPGKQLSSRLIEGKYPDYTKILPKHFESNALVDTKLFLDAVARVAVSAPKKNHVVSLELTNNEMILMAGTELGQSKESLEIQYEGKELMIDFDALYLIDALKIFLKDAPALSFMLNGQVQPAVLKGLNDDTYVSMLMPVKP
ncbi:MAG: DNA polymerase III subunit beta, partial [Nanoarchaeota archaeon]